MVHRNALWLCVVLCVSATEQQHLHPGPRQSVGSAQGYRCMWFNCDLSCNHMVKFKYPDSNVTIRELDASAATRQMCSFPNSCCSGIKGSFFTLPLERWRVSRAKVAQVLIRACASLLQLAWMSTSCSANSSSYRRPWLQVPEKASPGRLASQTTSLSSNHPSTHPCSAPSHLSHTNLMLDSALENMAEGQRTRS